jgi:hypothetical protein
MLTAEEIAKVTDEITNLESALSTFTDRGIREVIEIRIEERSLRLRQLRLAVQPLQQRPQARTRQNNTRP